MRWLEKGKKAGKLVRAAASLSRNREAAVPFGQQHLGHLLTCINQLHCHVSFQWLKPPHLCSVWQLRCSAVP